MTLFQYAMTLIHMNDKVTKTQTKTQTKTKTQTEGKKTKPRIKKEGKYSEQFTWSWTL
tara:strand:- start:55 stop:228 length:174 start_codon:yes stop_codon:yes gene_type:complete